MKPHILVMFDELHQSKLELDRLNFANIMLIPENEGVETPNDYRSTSFLNTLYKLITKVLTNKLRC